MREILSVFEPLPPQRAFMLSKARIRGYGGAMGGGKSRTGCETIFDYALDHPGLIALICRNAHTSIVETTKKTMLGQVIPHELLSRQKASAGEDYIELWNGSRIHFIGLEDPVRWYSSEIGALFFDECQEISEDTVLRLMTRLRQPGMPNNTILTFNPGNPGHWLQKWFLSTTEDDKTPPSKTEFGTYKPELWMQGALTSLGDAEFFFAKAVDNPYLPEGYVEQTLSGLKEWQRRRYLEGLWEFISGKCFFDIEALRDYELAARDTPPLFSGTTLGDIEGDMLHRVGRGPKPTDRIRVSSSGGPLMVWRKPVREHEDEQGNKKDAHRYVLAIDASSGRGRDWSALEILDVEKFEQVAEMQIKMETGLVAQEAYRLGRIYNDALIVPELSGGWGLAVEQVLKQLRYPKIYTRSTMDRLSKKWTDRTGWDTTTRTRMVVLEALETALREREFGLYSQRAIQEMGTFVYSEAEKAEAQPGCNDDMVMSLAIGVYITSQLPRQLKKPVEPTYMPQFASTGY